MYIYLLLSALAALSWAICVVLEKHYLLPYFKPQELLILRSSPYLIIFIIYLYSNKKLYEKVVNIDTKMAVLVLLSAILSFLGLYLFWYVLHNNKVNEYIDIAQENNIPIKINIGEPKVKTSKEKTTSPTLFIVRPYLL